MEEGSCPVRFNLDSNTVPELEVNRELLRIRLKLQGRRALYICAYYRANVSDEVSLLEFHQSLTRTLTVPNVHLLICDDLNFPEWVWQQMTEA